MEKFGRRELRELLDEQQGPCVSLFMPTDRTGRGTREGSIRCRNLLEQAEGQLCDAGLRRTAAQAQLKPLQDLVDNDHFWGHQSDGLALFASPGGHHRFRLPLKLDEHVAVGSRFRLSPLLPLLQGNGPFFLLAVSLKSIQFFAGTRWGLSPLAPEGLPQPLVDALKLDSVFEPPRLTPLGNAGLQAENSRQGFQHDQDGAGGRNKKEEGIIPFFRDLSDGLDQFFTMETAPLVFAGVDYLFPLFQQTCRYRYLVDRPVTGNPEGWTEQQLHRQAWEIVEPLYQRGLHQALEQYGDRAAHGLGSSDLGAVIHAAHEGRVDTLFVAEGKSCWGRVDDTAGVVMHAVNAQSPGSEDLLDHAVTQTLLQGGVVFAVPEQDLPAGEFAAAIFRFSNPAHVAAGSQPQSKF